jgi:hypothetical protein
MDDYIISIVTIFEYPLKTERHLRKMFPELFIFLPGPDHEGCHEPRKGGLTVCSTNQDLQGLAFGERSGHLGLA